jgi:hypothetical protein
MGSRWFHKNGPLGVTAVYGLGGEGRRAETLGVLREAQGRLSTALFAKYANDFAHDDRVRGKETSKDTATQNNSKSRSGECRS